MENNQRVVRRVSQDINSDTPITKVGSKMLDSTETMLAYVHEKVTLCDNKLLFDGSREPSLDELNRAIAEWPHAHLGLIMVYEQSTWELTIAKESYDEFLTDKLVETRQKFNTTDVAKTMWLSAGEIENFTKSNYKNELAALKTKVAMAERQKSTMLRILGSWENYSYQLNQLSKNSIAEVQGNMRASTLDWNPND